ncbi:MAG: hypothetical protein HY913_04480 [Desulfomonile tiedjei]|nr:hypothetical protein [Desulfomonile tiedjei]
MITPGDLKDAVDAYRDYGWYAGIGIPVLAFVLYLAYRYVLHLRDKVQNYLTNVEQRIEKITDAWVKNGKVVDQSVLTDEMRQAVQEIREINQKFDDVFMCHVEDTKRLADEEIWKHCPIERCPNLSQVLTFLEQVNRELKEFATEAQESRVQTRSSISDISTRIDKFIDGLGSEILITIRELRLPRDK